MLVLGRTQKNDTIILDFGDGVHVMLRVWVRHGRHIGVAIDAPQSVRVYRRETLPGGLLPDGCSLEPELSQLQHSLGANQGARDETK